MDLTPTTYERITPMAGSIQCPACGRFSAFKEKDGSIKCYHARCGVIFKPTKNHEPEWLSQALNEGDGVYRP